MTTVWGELVPEYYKFVAKTSCAEVEYAQTSINQLSADALETNLTGMSNSDTRLIIREHVLHNLTACDMI